MQSIPGADNQQLRGIPCCGRPAKVPRQVAVHQAVCKLPLIRRVHPVAAGQLQHLKAARSQPSPAVAAGIQAAPKFLRLPCQDSNSVVDNMDPESPVSQSDQSLSLYVNRFAEPCLKGCMRTDSLCACSAGNIKLTHLFEGLYEGTRYVLAQQAT